MVSDGHFSRFSSVTCIDPKVVERTFTFSVQHRAVGAVSGTPTGVHGAFRAFQRDSIQILNTLRLGLTALFRVSFETVQHEAVAKPFNPHSQVGVSPICAARLSGAGGGATCQCVMITENKHPDWSTALSSTHSHTP